MRQEDIIKDLEAETGKELDNNFQSQTLCDGDTCRHDECSCWEDFKEEVREALTKDDN